MKNQKGFIPVIIILVVLIGFVGIYYLGTLKPKNTTVNPTSTPTILNSPSSVATSKPAIPDPTANWKTYLVPNLNFEIKIPQSWSQLENKSHFKDSKNNEIVVIIDSNGVSLKNDLSVDAKELIEYELNYVPGTSYHSPKIVNTTNTNISGQDAIRYDIDLTKPVDKLPYNKESLIYLYKDSQIYTIYLYGNDVNTMNQILSTFKFTN